MEGVFGGLAAIQRGLQRVMCGVGGCSARRVLQSDVDFPVAVGLHLGQQGLDKPTRTSNCFAFNTETRSSTTKYIVWPKPRK